MHRLRRRGVAVKRLLYLSAFVLSAALGLATPTSVDGSKPRYATNEGRSVAMLGMSIGVIGGGLLLKHRRHD
jgi:hypothetical protein